MEITAVTYLRWIPLLPLLGAAVNGLEGDALADEFEESIEGFLATFLVLQRGMFVVAVIATMSTA